MVVDATRDGFEGVLTRLSAGELEITSVKSTPLIVRTAARDVNVCSDERVFSLQVVHSGRCRIRHAGIEMVAEAGDMIVADASKSYELKFAERVQGLTLPPPWSRFGSHAETLEALAGHRINVHSGPGAVLSTFIRSSWDQLVECEGEEWPESSAEIIWDLLAAVLRGETGRKIVRGRADSLRREAKALIDGRLADAAFQIAEVAEGLGVSARYLQMVFADAGTTPSRFLLARRLDAAAARLRNVDRPISITEVALECGFSDLSYFSRVFRRRYGVTAGAYRLSYGARSSDSP